MKKVLIIILFLFLFLPNICAGTKFYIGEKVPNMYIESKRGNLFHNGAPFVLKSYDNKIVYCINPFEHINEQNYYNEYNYNNSYFNLTDSMLNRINLISYYGYNYINHTDLKWYGITQFLIWKETGMDEIYFTGSYYGNKVIAYEQEISEVENLVNNHYKYPQVLYEDLSLSINSEYSYKDELFNKYKIKDSNIESLLKDNTLYINTPSIEGNYYIDFELKYNINNDYMLYGLNGYQSLIYPGKVDDVSFTLNIEVVGGTIIINKVDSENITRDFSNLEGALYDVYDYDNNIIDTLVTDNTGYAQTDLLKLGNYKVKEVKASTGYNIDTNNYFVNLSSVNKTSIIKSYEEVILGNIKIYKYYGDDYNYKLEDGAEFELYDINNNYIKTYSTKNGLIEDKLPYGKYYLKQIKGIKGYKYVDDLYINIDSEDTYEYELYNIYDPVIVEVPNTQVNIKKDYSSYILIFLGIILIIIGKRKTTFQ